MLRRLLVGLVVGALVGVAIAAALVAAFKVQAFSGTGGSLLAYAAAAAAGGLTGLVAGKPIWASGAQVEGGLKAFFGALLAVGGMFALRRWGGGWSVDLAALGAGGPAPVGELPAASLPLLAGVLGGFFGVDNSSDGDDEARPRARVGGAPGASAAGSRAATESDEDADAESPAGRARR